MRIDYLLKNYYEVHGAFLGVVRQLCEVTEEECFQCLGYEDSADFTKEVQKYRDLHREQLLRINKYEDAEIKKMPADEVLFVSLLFQSGDATLRKCMHNKGIKAMVQNNVLLMAVLTKLNSGSVFDSETNVQMKATDFLESIQLLGYTGAARNEKMEALVKTLSTFQITHTATVPSCMGTYLQLGKDSPLTEKQEILMAMKCLLSIKNPFHIKGFPTKKLELVQLSDTKLEVYKHTLAACAAFGITYKELLSFYGIQVLDQIAIAKRYGMDIIVFGNTVLTHGLTEQGNRTLSRTQFACLLQSVQCVPTTSAQLEEVNSFK